MRTLIALLLCCSMVWGDSTTETCSGSTDDVYYRQGQVLQTTATALNFGRTTTGLTYNIGIRFQTVTIPSGSTIDTVILNLDCIATNSTNAVLARAFCHDTSDADTFSDTTNFKARARTTAFLDWTLPSVTNTTTYRYGGATGNLKDPVQEVINLAGWASGNDLVFLLDENGGTNNRTRQFASDEHSTEDPPQVVIYYTTPSGVQNVYHGIAGVGVRHSIAGNSVLHKK